MILGGQIKLSSIFDHNFDRNTDRLYAPLRAAVEAMPNSSSVKEDIQTSSLSSFSLQYPETAQSRITISKAEQNIIKQSTFIPINKKLIETNNPQKRLKARSRSYKTLSFQQRVGAPVPIAMVQTQIAKSRLSKKTQIVYDYENLNSQKIIEIKKKLENYHGSLEKNLHPRSRSATYIGFTTENLLKKIQKPQAKIVSIKRKNSSNSSTSLKTKEILEQITEKSHNNHSQYYQNCRGYSFKNELNKKKQKKLLNQSNISHQKDLIKAGNNDYRYNLFNLLDKPVSSNCSDMLCHKNDIITPKIKNKW